MSAIGAPQIISVTTVASLLAVVAILGAALVASRSALPRGSSVKDKAIFVWLAFDLLIHLYAHLTASTSLRKTQPSQPVAEPPPPHPTSYSIFEGSFLALSCQTWPLSPNQAVNASAGMFGELWREYAIADARWGTADAGVVALELLTVLGAGPLCGWIMWQLARGDRGRHYWM